MNIKTTISAAYKASEAFVRKNAPTLLMGAGVGLMAGGTVSAVVATTKAVPKIQDMNEACVAPRKLDVVKEVWKDYIPAVGMTVGGAACIIYANKMNLTRLAAAAAAAQLNKDKLTEYKNSVNKVLGKKEKEAVKQDVAEQRVAAAGPIVGTYLGKGPQLCQETQTNQRFWSSKAQIESAINEINRRVINGVDRQTLNDFLYELGLAECEAGKNVGWEIGPNGVYDHPLEADFNYVVDEATGGPILCVDFDTETLCPF